MFAGLQSQVGSTDALGVQDPIAQLQSLIANGTPLQTIVDQIAQTVGNSASQQMAGQLSQQDLDQLKSSIVQQITNALSPPGTAPPGTPQQQVAQLVARLKRLIAKIEMGETQKPGQQNEIAGNVLDARSAKELPAQVRGTQTASALDVSSLVSSILNNAALKLSNGRPGYQANPVKAATNGRTGYSVNPLQAADNGRNGYTVNPLQAAVPGPVQDRQPQSAAPEAQPSGSALLSGTQSSAISMNNAPDLLARMLVRAAGVDAKITGNSALSGAASTQATSGVSQNPSSLLARFEAAIANVLQSDVASAPSGGSLNGRFSQSFGQQQGSQNSLGSQDTQTNLIAAPAVGPNDPLQSFAQLQSVQQARVDTSAIVEQMVKGMMMRTSSQGSSEIRLHLQPENLGDVTMKITVTGNQIQANVIAANADVRNALQSGHQQLAKSLANAGLTLSGFSVDVSGGDAGRDQNQGRASGFGRRYVVHELGVAPTEAQPVSNLGPALLSGKGLELFNYLV